MLQFTLFCRLQRIYDGNYEQEGNFFLKHMTSDIQDLVLKLRNLQVLLEDATIKGSHLKIRELVNEIRKTAEQIEESRVRQNAE